LAEDALYRLSLGDIALLGRRAMGVDIIDLVGIEIAVFEAHPHALGRAASLGRGRRDVVSVAVGGVTANLSYDPDAARNGGLALLEDEGRRALRHHESVALLVEWTAGLLRLFVAGRKRAHRDESAHPERGDCRLRAARDRGVQVAELDHPVGLADRMAARRAGAGGRKVDAARSVANRDLAGGKAADQLGDEEGRDVTQAGVHEDLVVLLDGAQAADADADQHADLVGIVVGDFEPGLAHRLFGGRDRILDEGVHFFDVALFDPVFRIEILHLAGDPGGKFRGVKARNRPNTGPPRHQGFPVLVHSNSERSHQSYSGDHHAALKHWSHEAPHPPSSSRLNNLPKSSRGRESAIAPCTRLRSPRYAGLASKLARMKQS